MPTEAELTAVVTAVAHDLTQQLIADAEGATKQVTIDVVGAAREDDAVEVGRSVARNNLVKTALFGNDPNWGASSPRSVPPPPCSSRTRSTWP